MAKVKSPYRATQKTGQAITGIAAFTAIAGLGVQIKNAAGATDEVELELATGGGAYLLTRDILSAEDYRNAIITESHLGNTYGSFMSPTKEGDAASAHEARSAEFEGTDYLAGSIDGETTVGTKVAWAAGKLAEWVSGDVAGEVTSILVPETPGNVRILVTFTL